MKKNNILNKDNDQNFDHEHINIEQKFEGPNSNQPNFYIPSAQINYYNNAPQQGLENRVVGNRDELPLSIAKEIRSEKLRLFFWTTISLAAIVFSIIMLVAYYRDWNGAETWLGLTRSKIIRPLFTIPLLLIGLIILMLSMSDSSFLLANVKNYKLKRSEGQEIIPPFIIRNYRALIRRNQIYNWLCFSLYFLAIVSLLILFGLQSQYNSQLAQGIENPKITILFWSFVALKSFDAEINLIFIGLVFTLVVHGSNAILIRVRKNNIVSYFGFDIISLDEVNQIKKTINKIGLVTWIIILSIFFFFIAIPIFVYKKRTGKKIWW